MFCEKKIAESKKNCKFAARFLLNESGVQMVIVAQLVRALVCGTRGRGFDPHHSPQKTRHDTGFFVYNAEMIFMLTPFAL